MSFTLGYIARIPPDAAQTDSPVDTAEAWTTQQNLYHCQTQSPQCYLNWLGLRDSEESSIVEPVIADIRIQRAVPFIATWWRADRPADFKLMVKARHNSGIATVHLEARVVADVGPVWSASAPVLCDGGGANIPGATSSQVIEAHDALGPFAEAAQGFQTFDAVENGVHVAVDAFLARVELAITSDVTDGEAIVEITGVHVWGFS